eukprot:gene1207-2690_t
MQGQVIEEGSGQVAEDPGLAGPFLVEHREDILKMMIQTMHAYGTDSAKPPTGLPLIRQCPWTPPQSPNFGSTYHLESPSPKPRTLASTQPCRNYQHAADIAEGLSLESDTLREVRRLLAEQQFLRLLCCGDTLGALKCLKTTVAPSSCDQNRVQLLSRMLTLKSPARVLAAWAHMEGPDLLPPPPSPLAGPQGQIAFCSGGQAGQEDSTVRCRLSPSALMVPDGCSAAWVVQFPHQEPPCSGANSTCLSNTPTPSTPGASVPALALGGSAPGPPASAPSTPSASPAGDPPPPPLLGLEGMQASFPLLPNPLTPVPAPATPPVE